MDKTEEQEQYTADAAEPNNVKPYVPYIENVVGFLLMCVIAYFQRYSPVNPLIYFDVNFIYIGTMGILYGKRQSIIAMVLSAVLLVYCLVHGGANVVALMYMPMHLLHLISYLFVAIVAGYFSDSRRYERQAAAWQHAADVEKYNFLKEKFEEDELTKDRLYRQILNSDDSIGRLYRIIKRLDSVAVENVFTQAASVVSEILGTYDIAVYVVGAEKRYLRQKVRMGELSAKEPRSIRVEDRDYMVRLVNDKELYVNRELVGDTPDIAAPIVYQDETIAVIEIFGMTFEQWSLNEQNLLLVTTRLIAAAMGRAYMFEADTIDKRYIQGTRFLREDAMKDIENDLVERGRVQGHLTVAEIELDQGDMTAAQLDEKVSPVIRSEDFAGLRDGRLFILLPDADDKAAEMVMGRLAKKGVTVKSHQMKKV